MTVQYSDDAGTTWHSASVAGSKVIFPTPAGPSISLKSHVTDKAGNTTDQTVIAAYTIR